MAGWSSIFSLIDLFLKPKKLQEEPRSILPKLPEHKAKQQGGQFHTTHLQALRLAEAPSLPLQINTQRQAQ